MKEQNLQEGTWVRLNNRALFRITGPDRVRYLNGQVSNDVAGPLHETAVAACVCSLKGKVEFLVWISAIDDVLYLDGQLDQREELEARLDRYLIADDCTITDVTEEMELIHLLNDSDVGVSSQRIGIAGRDLLQKQGEAALDPEKEMNLSDFEHLQALAKVPAAPWEISGGEFPAELGIANWAVDFHKGCYLGQEVISRIKSVGKVKRHLALVSAESELRQDSKVRTEGGREGRITRGLKKNEGGKHLALCLLKGTPDHAETLAPQDVEVIDAIPPNE